MTYDLVIRNGMVVDGSGLPPTRADVAIRAGRIAAVGRVPADRSRSVDAEGHVVTAGFIDGHTHMDAQVFWDPLGSCSSWHGVTTVVMGHCGFTLAPARADERHLVVRNLERAEDIAPEALAAGVPWGWESFPDYLDAVERTPKAIHHAANVGHSALRTWAMGERAFDGPAGDDELATMAGALEEALEAGAIGFTTTRNDLHETSDDRPVASRLASWGEVVQLVEVMSRRGAGLFQMTPETAMSSADPEARADAVARLRALAVDSGVPTFFGVGASPAGLATLDLIDETAAAGGRMVGLAHSRGISVTLSFETQLPFDRLPSWREVRSQPLPEQQRLLGQPEVRERLVREARSGPYPPAVGAEPREPDYDLMYVLDRPMPPYRSVADLAAERGVHPVELMLDVALATDLRAMFVQPVRHFAEDDLVRVMKHPRTVMTFSDAGAHVSQMSDCSIQTHLLSYWVREREEFTLEEAVRMLTLVPATHWGFHDRGLVREGFVADLNVLDPATVGAELPWVEHDLPGGAKRIKQRARGYLATVVGGEVTFERGEHTGALPGTLLRGPLARR